MKRFALLTAVSMIVIGCHRNDQSGSTPSTKPTQAGGTSDNRKLKDYFELMQDGKTYVAEDHTAIDKVTTGDHSGTWSKDWTDANGKLVVLEDDGKGMADALKKEYEKSHPKTGK